jgi:hypothetical protein
MFVELTRAFRLLHGDMRLIAVPGTFLRIISPVNAVLCRLTQTGG